MLTAPSVLLALVHRREEKWVARLLSQPHDVVLQNDMKVLVDGREARLVILDGSYLRLALAALVLGRSLHVDCAAVEVDVGDVERPRFSFAQARQDARGVDLS